MSGAKYVGSQLSKDTRQAVDLTPKAPVPPGFSCREEWNGFQEVVRNAHANGLLPWSVKNAQQAIVIAQKGRELGLDPLYSLSVIHLINGSPSLEGEVMLALVFKRYPKAQIKWIESSHKQAILEMGREGGVLSRFQFTIQEALQAGLIVRINPDGTVVGAKGKEVWEKYTADMLSWRAVARAVRRIFPECIMGCLTPDEASSAGPAQEMRDLKDAKTLDSDFAPKSGNETNDAAPAALAPAAEPIDVVTKDLAQAGVEIGSDDESKPKRPPVPAKPKPQPEPDPFPFELDNSGEYQFPGGKYFGKRVKELTKAELTEYLEQLKKRQASVGPNDTMLAEMISAVCGFLGVK